MTVGIFGPAHSLGTPLRGIPGTGLLLRHFTGERILGTMPGGMTPGPTATVPGTVPGTMAVGMTLGTSAPGMTLGTMEDGTAGTARGTAILGTTEGGIADGMVATAITAIWDIPDSVMTGSTLQGIWQAVLPAA